MEVYLRSLRRAACRKCGANSGLSEQDGRDCDGMPGVTYKVCNNCGHAQPKTIRPRKEKLRSHAQ